MRAIAGADEALAQVGRTLRVSPRSAGSYHLKLNAILSADVPDGKKALPARCGLMLTAQPDHRRTDPRWACQQPQEICTVFDARLAHP